MKAIQFTTSLSGESINIKPGDVLWIGDNTGVSADEASRYLSLGMAIEYKPVEQEPVTLKGGQ